MSETPEIFTTMSFESKLTRVIGNVLVPSIFKINIDFEPQDGVTEHDMDMAFMRIKYWLDNVVNRCVVFSKDNQNALAMFVEDGAARIGNVMMITPEEPDDQHLCALFQAKLTALSNGAMEFGTVELRSDNIMNLTFTYIGDAGLSLPENKDWVGERSYYDKPWWHRCDGTTLDLMPPEGADLSLPPPWAFSFEFFEKGRARPESEKNPVVLRPEFRPQVIDGGKDKD